MAEKIGFISSSSSYGGLEINVVRLAGWLKHRGRKVCLLAPGETPMFQEARAIGIETLPIQMHRKYLDLSAGRRLAKQIADSGIGILVISATYDISVAAWAKRFSANLRLVYHQHMQIGVNKKDFLHTLRYGRLDAWISPLQFLAAQVKERTRYDPRKIHIIPFGIDFSTIKLIPKKEARKKIGLPQEPMIAGMLGRIDQQKGQLFVVECFAQMKSQGPGDRTSREPPFGEARDRLRQGWRRGRNVELLLAGEPTRNEGDEFMNRLQSFIGSSGISEKIHLKGFFKDVGLFFSAIDIFLMASDKETYGMVTIEAMAAGVPVLGTRAGGTTEILQDGRLGGLYNPHNHDEFIEQLGIITENYSAALKIAAGTKEIARATYSHERECDLIETLFDTLS